MQYMESAAFGQGQSRKECGRQKQGNESTLGYYRHGMLSQMETVRNLTRDFLKDIRGKNETP
jgi:hypothetical protein